MTLIFFHLVVSTPLTKDINQFILRDGKQRFDGW